MCPKVSDGVLGCPSVSLGNRTNPYLNSKWLSHLNGDEQGYIIKVLSHLNIDGECPIHVNIEHCEAQYMWTLKADLYFHFSHDLVLYCSHNLDLYCSQDPDLYCSYDPGLHFTWSRLLLITWPWLFIWSWNLLSTCPWALLFIPHHTIVAGYYDFRLVFCESVCTHVRLLRGKKFGHFAT